mgnify:CR=1 FL=1
MRANTVFIVYLEKVSPSCCTSLKILWNSSFSWFASSSFHECCLEPPWLNVSETLEDCVTRNEEHKFKTWEGYKQKILVKRNVCNRFQQVAFIQLRHKKRSSLTFLPLLHHQLMLITSPQVQFLCSQFLWEANKCTVNKMPYKCANHEKSDVKEQLADQHGYKVL